MTFQLYRTDDEIAVTNEAAHAPAMARGAKCRECPLWGCERGPVLGQIVPNSKLAVIGEAPGNKEVEKGRPFIGASGHVLDTALEAGGMAREDTTVTDVLLCQPPDDFESYLEKLRYLAKKEDSQAVLPTDCCAPRLKRDLEEANSTVELAVGGQALKAMAHHHGVAYGKTQKVDEGQLRVATLRKQHGAPVVLNSGESEAPRKVLMASYHPAFAFRGAKAWMPVIKKVIARSARLAQRDGVIDWERPYYNIDPTIEEVEAFAELVIRHDAMTTIDIETDGAHTRTCKVRCVGMGTTIDGVEHIIVVPLRNMDGSLEWGGDAQLLTRAALAVRRVMDTVPLTMQNGSFDTSVMLRVGLMTAERKAWFDCMLAHHNTDSNDLPHDLGFITSEEFEAPHHKDDADHSVVDNVGYERLKLYNGDDILTTMRLVEPLWKRINDLGTYAQFKTDTDLAPVCRDMGDLGIVVDERERQRLAGVLSAKCDFHEAQFRFHAACVVDCEAEPNRARTTQQAIEAEQRIKRELRGNEQTERLTRLYKEFSEHQGFQELNPRSPPQLKEWLYENEGLTPQLNTDGFDYDDDSDDSPSTSTAALLKLQDKYPHVTDAVDALLEYRAYNKLYGTYVADKKGRIRDVDWTQWGLPTTPWARILNTVYKVHIIPSGRLSTQPAIQNWPSVGKANMRMMVCSPPGHCIVGADYDQLELRIYAVIAQDKWLLQAFTEGLDPHSLNAAALLCDHESQIMDVYKRIINSDPKEKKYWRGVAKRFCYLECFGEDSEVLTRRGLVAIQNVRKDDLVWDGIEWVEHDGVIYKGEKEVITWDGVTATPDHKVWLDCDGSTCTLEEAALAGLRLARGSDGGRPVRFMDSDDRAYQGGAVYTRGRPMSMRSKAIGVTQRLGARSHYPVQVLWAAEEGQVTSKARATSSGFEEALYESKRHELEILRRSRCRVPISINARSRSMDIRQSRIRRGAGTRPHRHEWPLRAGQFAMGNTAAEQSESSMLYSTSRFRVQIDRVALLRGIHFEALSSRVHTRIDLGISAEKCEQQTKRVAATRKVVRVYDLVNAGPRRRFTVSGRVCSNCYGGEEDKLFSSMSASRNKATGKRDFPELKIEEVMVWHERWHKLHPETKIWQQACQRVAYQDGVVGVCTLDYRKRHFPGGIDKKNSPVNHTIQGFAASIANRALLRLAEAIPHRGWSPASGIAFQIHDYIGAYVPRERAWEAKHLVEECLFYEHDNMPFTCTADVSERWSDQG